MRRGWDERDKPRTKLWSSFPETSVAELGGRAFRDLSSHCKQNFAFMHVTLS